MFNAFEIIANPVTGKSGIICYDGSFHRRTMMAMTLTSNVKYKECAGPYAPEVYRLEYPYYKPSMSARMTQDEFDYLDDPRSGNCSVLMYWPLDSNTKLSENH